MEPMTAMMVASVAAPIVGGIIGNAAASKDRKAMMAATQAAWAKLDEIGMPPDLSEKLILQQFQQAGVYEPELLKDIQLNMSSVGQLTERAPELREAQLQALRDLQERAELGFGVEDRVNLNELRRDVARNAEARRQSIIADMARRGMSGSGAEILQQLQASQGGEELASQQADALMKMAAQNALAARAQTGELAGGIRAADWNQDLARAQAQDEFSMADFNARNQRQQFNVDAKNQAQMANLAEKQRIQDVNTQMQNQEMQRQQNAKRQYWLDQLNKAQSYGGVSNQMANAYDQQADQKAQMWAGFGQSVGQGAQGYGTYLQKQQEWEQGQAMRDADLKYKQAQTKALLSPPRK